MDEQNRKALYKLRLTWNEVFSNRTLYDVDVRIKQIDHAWPITASNAQPPLNNQTNLQSLSQPKSTVNSTSSISSLTGSASTSAIPSQSLTQVTLKIIKLRISFYAVYFVSFLNKIRNIYAFRKIQNR